MNKAILIGRLTRDIELRYSTGEKSTAVVRFTLAVDRRFKRDNEQSADFINCVAFGKSAEFLEKYFYKGMKVSVIGHIQTGSYTNKEGNKIYTTDIIAEEVDFVESKRAEQQDSPSFGEPGEDGFIDIPEGIDEELPFN